jgi:hypothetical protein
LDDPVSVGVERDINNLTPWSASTMAGLSLRGVKFALFGEGWRATWKPADERFERCLTDRALWKLVHQTALAFGDDK